MGKLKRWRTIKHPNGNNKKRNEEVKIMGKIKRLIKIEGIVIVIISISTIFKAITDKILSPRLSLMIPLCIIGLIILGLGIWFEKL